MRKTSPNQCPYCNRSLPMALPPYMRVSKGKDGIWRPKSGICQCDKPAYKFFVTDLADLKNKKSGK